MDFSVDVAIIGAGSAGISAFKEASKKTNNIVLIDQGPLGTTCARVGCMPSKALIQVADYFQERFYFAERGIKGADKLTINITDALQYVRKMRDDFTSGMVRYTESLGKQFIKGHAVFREPHVLEVGKHKIIAKNIIIATGSSPYIPRAWQAFAKDLLTSDSIFEQDQLCEKISVIGAGVIGLELGQAINRLGIEINIFHSGGFIGNLTDPSVNDYAVWVMQEEFPLYVGQKATVQREHDSFIVKSGNKMEYVPQILAALGRKPNLENLDLEKIGIAMDERGIPIYNKTTFKIENAPIYIIGDVNHSRPLLHEAVDEGRIAGFNAVRTSHQCFRRRTPLIIVFSQPNIARAGKSFAELKNKEIIIGEVLFDNQGRSRIMGKNKGILRIYGEPENGKLLGAEMIAPAGEHLAHLLAWCIQQNMTVFDVLRMPFYHPVVEEGMRTALRDLAKKVQHADMKASELALCDSSAPGALA